MSYKENKSLRVIGFRKGLSEVLRFYL